MPSLKQMLEHSQLFQAARGLDKDPGSRRLKDGPFDAKPRMNPGSPAQDPADNSIWAWTYDVDKPNVVTNLRALTRGMEFHDMLVCNAVRFSDVRVRPANVIRAFGKSLPAELNLRLEPKFRFDTFFLDDGALPMRNVGGPQRQCRWLPAKVDNSFLTLFAYEFDPAIGDLIPWKPSFDTELDAFPDPDDYSSEVRRFRASAGQTVNVRLGVAHFLVAVCLTCCTEKPDFEPGGVLGAGRFYPQVMVAANIPLEEIENTITLERPKKSSMAAHAHHVKDPVLRREMAEMKEDIGIIYVEDTNVQFGLQPPGAPAVLPMWDNFFDYYDVNPIVNVGAGNDLQVTRHFSLAPNAKDPHLKWEKERPVIDVIEKGTFGTTRKFVKAPRQGAFDNVHLAPKMVATVFGAPAIKLDDVAMAPFCIHDCLHAHVRWGNPTANPMPIQALGFDRDFNPLVQEKAPLVPPNQDVFYRIVDSSTIAYKTIVRPPIPRGNWMILNHQGGAYALSIADPGAFFAARAFVQVTANAQADDFSEALILPAEPARLNAQDSVAAFYWRLRFHGVDKERVHSLGANKLFLPDLRIAMDA